MKKRYKILLFILVLIISFLVYFNIVTKVNQPKVDLSLLENQTTVAYTDSLSTLGNNWLHKNEYGLWEIYLEGKPFERGLAFGKLGQNLSEEKEASFVEEIQKRIPSPIYFNFLKYVVGWFNRDLENNITDEFSKEIYGSSFYMSDNYDYIAPKYHRSLNYHAAHDIGHALQNLNMVGCTAFAVKNNGSEKENSLLVGRNFDFYFGESFAKDKLVAFVKPDSGYRFMSVTWAGFSGVVSGMNEKGLTVTLNSAKTGVITKAKTPVSIIGRHILQFASTIDEAYEIASSYDAFVSETFLISSSIDNDVAVIEKSNIKTAIYRSKTDQTIVTNHFQSDELKDDPNNLDYLEEGVSQYRYKRVEQLLSKDSIITPESAAYILRNQKGLNDLEIGMANEKAINQLIAHHSIIFSPHQLKVWVSAPPYQLGKYLCYDLKKIFHNDFDAQDANYIFSDSLNIAEDKFLYTKKFEKYKAYIKILDKIRLFLFQSSDELLTEEEESLCIAYNPESYLSYYYLGDYYLLLEDYKKASNVFKTGLTKVIARKSEKEHMEKGLETCLNHLNE